jgi:hypothetical protein
MGPGSTTQAGRSHPPPLHLRPEDVGSGASCGGNQRLFSRQASQHDISATATARAPNWAQQRRPRRISAVWDEPTEGGWRCRRCWIEAHVWDQRPNFRFCRRTEEDQHGTEWLEQYDSAVAGRQQSASSCWPQRQRQAGSGFSRRACRHESASLN